MKGDAMGEPDNKNGIKRRDFLKLGVVTVTGAAVGLSVGKVLEAAKTGRNPCLPHPWPHRPQGYHRQLWRHAHP